MYEGFSDNRRPIETVDIIKELKESVPISTTMKEKVTALREWAEKRARHASKLKKRKIKDQEIIDTVKALMENVSNNEEEEEL